MLLLAALALALGQRQRECAVQGVNRLLNPTTSMTSINMSCPVDTEAEVNISDQFVWVWLRLDNSVDSPIRDGITSGKALVTLFHFFAIVQSSISFFCMQTDRSPIMSCRSSAAVVGSTKPCITTLWTITLVSSAVSL